MCNRKYSYIISPIVLWGNISSQSETGLYNHMLLSQWQILGTGNLPQDSAPVCINIDISPEMAAQSVQRNQAFCVNAPDWSPITTA